MQQKNSRSFRAPEVRDIEQAGLNPGCNWRGWGSAKTPRE